MRLAVRLLFLSCLVPVLSQMAVAQEGEPGGAGIARARVERICAEQRWPFWIATCSDPELRALAVERIEAQRAVAVRLNPDGRSALRSNQREWAVGYARGCGIMAGTAPAVPPSPEMRDCLIRGARDRIVYLRSYAGGSSGQGAASPAASLRPPPASFTAPSSAAADAFDEWCKTVKLPSSIAICSDPELRALAIERQSVFNEVRWGLDPQRDKALLADQRGWVKSYPLACGIDPAVPPVLPLTPEIKACMARAGKARIAYLRTYGLGSGGAATAATPTPLPSLPSSVPAGPPPSAPVPTTSTTTIGPSFDCNNVHQPLALMICANPALSKLDLRFVQAYQALRYQLDEPGRRQLHDEDLQFLASVRQLCAVPETGPVSGSSECIAAQYERQRAIWTSRLNGPAAEEANRPIEQQIALQARLQKIGFLPSAVKVDGVYGDAMRSAILAWQGVNGRPETGFLGDADAAALTGAAPREAKETTPGMQPPSAPSSAPVSQLQSPGNAVSPPSSSPGQSPSAPPGPPADPEWRRIDSSQLFGSDAEVFGQVTEIYIDARSITRHGSTITAWIMNNTNEKGEEVRRLARQKFPQYTQTHKPETWSTIDEFEFNCQPKQFRYLYVADFTDHMGKGRPIYWDDTNGVELNHPVMNGKELPSVWVSGVKGTGFDMPLLESLCNGSLLRSLGVSAPEVRPQKEPTAASPTASPSIPLTQAPENSATEPSDARARVIKLCSSESAAIWVAICSDYELREITAERFEAYDKLAARLSPEQVNAGAVQQLFASARSWDATYAVGCGIEPGAAPTIPLAPEIRDCLVRGARDLLASLSERQRYWTDPCEGLAKTSSGRVNLSPRAISARIHRPVASVTFQRIPSRRLDPLSFACRLTVTLPDGSSTFSDVTVDFSSAYVKQPAVIGLGEASPAQPMPPSSSTAPFLPRRTANADDPCTNPNHPQWQMPAWAMTLPAWRQMALNRQQQLRRECQIKAQQQRDAENAARDAAQRQAAAQEAHNRAIEQGEALGYRPESFDDFILDGKQLATDNAKIQLFGYYKKIGGGALLFKSTIDALQNSRNSIPLLIEDAAREVRAYFLGCDRNPGTAQAGCQVSLGGHVQLCRYLDPAHAEYPPVPCLNVEQGSNG